MQIGRPVLVVPFLAIVVWAAAAPIGDVALPEHLLPQLDGILKSAVQQSPRMVSRALELEMAEQARVVARSNILPTVAANGSYLESSDKTKYVATNSSTVNSYNVTKTPYSASISQPIFYWGERRNNNTIGEIQLKMAQGNYREAYRLLAQELRGGYVRLILQKLSAKRSAYNSEYMNRLLVQQEERLTKKEISEVEISIARLNAEQAQIAKERSMFDYQNALVSFARLSGGSSVTDESLPEVVPAATYTASAFDQVLAGFLAQKDPPTLEAQNLHKQLEIENLVYANTKTRLRPKVNAVAGLTEDEQNNLYGTGQRYSITSKYVGISVYWTIFDGFTSGAMTRSSLARRRILENDYHQVTDRLARDAQNQVKQLNFAARSMAITDRLLVSGEGYLHTVQSEFQRGAKSESDVSLAQLALYDAQINAGVSRNDYFYRVGDFLGTVVEDPALANLADK